MCLASTTSFAQELHVLELREFSMDAAKLVDNRDPYYPYADKVAAYSGQEVWDKEAIANFDIDVLRYGQYAITFDNHVHGESTDQRFREVGWHYRVSAELGRKVSVYYEHHSQHLLDESGGPTTAYPLYNAVGCRFTLYKRGD